VSSLNKQTNEQTRIQIFLYEVQTARLQSGRQQLHLWRDQFVKCEARPLSTVSCRRHLPCLAGFWERGPRRTE